MAGLTVVQVRTEQRDLIKTRLSALTKKLAAADAVLAAATATRAQFEKQLGATQREEADQRVRLAAASMAANIHALEQLLEANLLAQGVLRGQLAAAQDAVASRQNDRGRLAAHLTRARTELAGAETTVLAAMAASLENTGWNAALQDKPLKEAVTAAAGKPVSDEVAAARAKVGAHLGNVEFVDLLDSRLADALSRNAEPDAALARATAASEALTSALAPSEGALASKAEEYLRARAGVRAVVEGVVARLSEARAQLQLVIASSNLTAAEVAYIAARAVGPLAVAPAGALSPVGKEKAMHDAAVTVRQATGAFEAAALLAEATDPKFDRDDPLVLVTERQARDTAVTALGTAQAAFTGVDKETIDKWEVAIPPGTFALAIDAVRAAAAIDEIKALSLTGTGSLQERLANTEVGYAAALRDRLLEQERDVEQRDRVQQYLEAVATQAPVAAERLVAFVRGDA